MQPRRIILADDSCLHRDIIRKLIVKAPDLELVGVASDLAGLLSVLRETEVEWIVLSLQPDLKIPHEIELNLMTEFPSVHILGLSMDGSRVRVLQLGQHEKVFQELTWEKIHNILLGG